MASTYTLNKYRTGYHATQEEPSKQKAPFHEGKTLELNRPTCND